MTDTTSVALQASAAQAGPMACDAGRTAALLDFSALVDALAEAAADVQAGLIFSPERQVLPLGDPGDTGEAGVLLSMPATSHDIGIHKLVTVLPANKARGLPTIHGTVTVCDAPTGRPLCVLDGPEVTGRRTAAVSLLAIRMLLPQAPRGALLVGTGIQAAHHVRALRALYPDCELWARGSSASSTEAFCAAHVGVMRCPDGLPPEVDVVILLTTSREPVYDEAPVAGRLVIGAGAFKPGMAEIGKTTLDGSDIYADDPAGARHEAGDLLRAGIDWSRVKSLADALGAPDLRRPIVFKSVGSAAWDLAAARVALGARSAGPDAGPAGSETCP